MARKPLPLRCPRAWKLGRGPPRLARHAPARPPLHLLSVRSSRHSPTQRQGPRRRPWSPGTLL
eukprot:6034667-Lingulodinium_polyedra.AAC.1